MRQNNASFQKHLRNVPRFQGCAPANGPFHLPSFVLDFGLHSFGVAFQRPLPAAKLLERVRLEIGPSGQVSGCCGPGPASWATGGAATLAAPRPRRRHGCEGAAVEEDAVEGPQWVEASAVS